MARQLKRTARSARRLGLLVLLGVLGVGSAVWVAVGSGAPPPPAPVNPPSITAGPANASTSGPNVSFSFSYSPPAGITFQCSLDGASFSSCSSPKSYSGLVSGPHTFKVAAKNGSSGLGPQASRSWTVDATPPTVTSISTVDPSPTKASPLHWTVTFSEAVSGVVAADFGLVRSGMSGSSITTVSPAGPASSYTVTVSTAGASGANGATLGLNLTSKGSIQDSVGNPLAGSTPVVGQAYLFDTTAPTVTSITTTGPSPTNHGPLHWTVTFSEPVLNVTSLRFGFVPSGGLAGSPSITSVAPAAGPSATWTVTVNTTGVTGTDTSQLGLNLTSKGAITDQAGNALGGSTPVVGGTYMYDTTLPPAPTILLGPLPHPPGAVPYNFALFSFTDPEVGGDSDHDEDDTGSGGFLCKLDTGAFTSCPGFQFYSNLLQGLHTFQVEAVDSAGNVSAPTSWTWFVDTVAPTVTFTQVPPDPSSTATSTFNWIGSDPAPGSGIAYYLCSKENGPFVPCPAGTPPYTFVVQTTNNGQHQFAVEAVDNAGNVSAPAKYKWKVAKSSGQDYTISGTLTSPIWPTNAATGTPINVTFNNPNSDSVRVSSLTVSITSITAPHATPLLTCTTADFAVTQFTGSYPFYIPVGASSLSLLVPAIPSTQWPTVLWVNSATRNQDGCEGATITLSYTGAP